MKKVAEFLSKPETMLKDAGFILGRRVDAEEATANTTIGKILHAQLTGNTTADQTTDLLRIVKETEILSNQ